MNGTPSFGTLLRSWRQRRRHTQMSLALEAEVSARHLSCLETGKAKPSGAMIETLAEVLEVPLQQRNAMLLAAGLAPRYASTGLGQDEARHVRAAVEFLLVRHHPYPALVVDEQWDVMMANDAYVQLVCALRGGPAPPPRPEAVHRGPPLEGSNALLPVFEDPAIRSRLRNEKVFARAVLEHLRGVARTHRGAAEVRRRIQRAVGPLESGHGAAPLVIPLEFDVDGSTLAMFSTMTMLGTSADVVLSTMRVETHFPANPHSERLLRAIAAGNAPP